MAKNESLSSAFEIVIVFLGILAFLLCLKLEMVPRWILYFGVVGFWFLSMLLLLGIIVKGYYGNLTKGDGFRVSRRAIWALPLLTLAAGLSFSGAVGFGFATLNAIYIWSLAPTTNETVVLWVSVPATLLAGLVLFAFRLHMRLAYGISEVCVGLFVAWVQIKGGGAGSLLSGNFLLPFITAAVYLVVRGLDNIHQGWRSSNSDAITRVLKRVVDPKIRYENL